MSEDELRKIRGAQIAMIFQDPLSSLNPVLTIGRQITEAIETHKGRRARRTRKKRAIELLELVGIPNAASAGQRLPAPVQRRDAPARDDRDGPQLRAEPAHRRRADDRARRDHPGPDPGPAAPAADRARDGRPDHHPRPRRRRRASPTGWPSCTPAGSSSSARPRRSWPIPSHPYTVGLLRSLPRLDRPRQAALTPIEGSPPDLASTLEGCPFAPRCGWRLDPLLDGRRRRSTIAGGERLEDADPRRPPGRLPQPADPRRGDRRRAADAPASPRPRRPPPSSRPSSRPPPTEAE